MKGKRIINPGRIVELAMVGKSIEWRNIRLPAMFIVHWPLLMIVNSIRSKVLFEYKPKK